MSAAEETLALQIMDEKLTGWDREYRFGAMAAGGPGKGLRKRLADADLKDWRFDFAHPGLGLAVEVEGITRYGKTRSGKMGLGRHQTSKGMEEDLRKYDAAMRMGWTVYRCSPLMVRQGHAIETIKRLVQAAEECS